MEGFLRGVGWVAAIAGAIGLLVYLFLLDLWLIPTDEPMLAVSVAPNLYASDRLVVERHGSPRTGQLVRCASPETTGKFVIGRVFGMGGEIVEMRDERVLVGGQGVPARRGCPPRTITHPITGQQHNLACSLEDNGAFAYEVLLEPDHPDGYRRIQLEPATFYLVSDNRHLHHDSRDFGPVPSASCQHVIFRLWGESFVDSSRRFNILW